MRIAARCVHIVEKSVWLVGCHNIRKTNGEWLSLGVYQLNTEALALQVAKEVKKTKEKN